MKKTVNISFDFGEEVVLKTDPEKIRIVTGITMRPSGKLYELAHGETTSWHQSCEIRYPEEAMRIKGFSGC